MQTPFARVILEFGGVQNCGFGETKTRLWFVIF